MSLVAIGDHAVHLLTGLHQQAVGGAVQRSGHDRELVAAWSIERHAGKPRGLATLAADVLI